MKKTAKATAGQRAAGSGPEALPEHLRVQHTHVVCGEDLNYHTATATTANIYMGLGLHNRWSQQDFESAFRVVVNWLKQNDLQFDLVGLDPAIANALRRILISEVPSMAIENVFIVNNTSIIPCEVLSQRLGLVPICMDPDHFATTSAEEPATEKNTIVYKLSVACKRGPDGMILNDKVYSSQLRWLPEGSEMPEETSCRFAGSQAAALPHLAQSVQGDILIAKMRPGQAIELEAHCVKGTGRVHAKWSPVATAWYRLQPEVALLEPVQGQAADALQAECPQVFSVVGDGAERRVVAVDARSNELHLEKVRRLAAEENWAGSFEVRKRKDHFIYTIESTGALPPNILFQRALDILAEKCDRLLERL